MMLTRLCRDIQAASLALADAQSEQFSHIALHAAVRPERAALCAGRGLKPRKKMLDGHNLVY
jgi:hypothetical protein